MPKLHLLMFFHSWLPRGKCLILDVPLDLDTYETRLCSVLPQSHDLAKDTGMSWRDTSHLRGYIAGNAIP